MKAKWIGNSPKTAIGNGQQPLVAAWAQILLKKFLGLFMRNTTRDSAKTQVFLSASKRVIEENIHGQYWTPVWSWRQSYVRSRKDELAGLAKDEKEWKLLWEFCETTTAKAAAVSV